MSVSLTDNCEEEERDEEQKAGASGRARKKEVMKVSDITEELSHTTPPASLLESIHHTG